MVKPFVVISSSIVYPLMPLVITMGTLRSRPICNSISCSSAVAAHISPERLSNWSSQKYSFGLFVFSECNFTKLGVFAIDVIVALINSWAVLILKQYRTALKCFAQQMEGFHFIMSQLAPSDLTVVAERRSERPLPFQTLFLSQNGV